MEINLYRFKGENVDYNQCTIIAGTVEEARALAKKHDFPEPFYLEKKANLSSLTKALMIHQQVLPF